MKQTPHRIMHDSLLSIGRSAAWPLFMRNVNTNYYVSSYGVEIIISMREASEILLHAFNWDDGTRGWSFWNEIRKELVKAEL